MDKPKRFLLFTWGSYFPGRNGAHGGIADLRGSYDTATESVKEYKKWKKTNRSVYGQSMQGQVFDMETGKFVSVL